MKEVYNRYIVDADVCVVEGMMGMYDGYDRDRGSSAEIASMLGLPVVLVVDARSAAYSMAPLLSGFVSFRKDVNVCGVIFNKVGSARHCDMLRQVCDDLHIECLGCLPKHSSLEQGSRYLGLDFSEKAGTDKLTALLEKHIDWQRILEVAEKNASATTVSTAPESTETGNMSISVALNDESFSFVYQEHLDMLKQMGNVTFFDPEQNDELPVGTELLYLPGGYPEKHLETLVEASATRNSIRQYARQGGTILAECGGMMYLCDKIISDEGEYNMCGVLPYSISSRKDDRKLSLGYRQMEWNGLPLRGHEFHYTQFKGDIPRSSVQVYNAKGEKVETPVFQQGNILASYTHLYWGMTRLPDILNQLRLSCERR
jgi:cobyrinic acid a,c-diamide synthase